MAINLKGKNLTLTLTSAFLLHLPLTSANRWPLAQARCFFNASLSSSTYFQETMLGLPPPHNKSPRTAFNRPDLLTTPLLKPITECMSQSKDAFKVMQGYIDHLAFNFVKPGKWRFGKGRGGACVILTICEIASRAEFRLYVFVPLDDITSLFLIHSFPSSYFLTHAHSR